LENSFDGIVETGTDGASVFLSEIQRELLELLERADLVIAKGMAHYEYLSEISGELGAPILYMLKAKCEIVASSLSVQKGSYAAVLQK